MILSLVTCGVTFAVIGLVMNGLMPYEQLALESAPLAAAAATFTAKGALIIALGGIFAAISTLNGLMMSGSRMIYAMGKEGSLPRVLAKVNPKTVIAPIKNIVDLIHYKGMINNKIINLNSKLYNENDVGFEIYVSALK